MPRYRSNPVEIDAVQWTGKNMDEIFTFMGSGEMEEADVFRGEHFIFDPHDEHSPLIIYTAHGNIPAEVSDYIMQLEDGSYGPYPTEAFLENYTLIPEEVS